MSAHVEPFSQMAGVLAGTARSAWPVLPARQDAHEAAPSRTEQIRQLLRMGGPLSAVNIALQLDLERPALVSALLKVDLQRGRVRRIGPLYEWSHGYDEGLVRELGAAAQFLRRHGYTVRRPA